MAGISRQEDFQWLEQEYGIIDGEWRPSLTPAKIKVYIEKVLTS